MPHKNGFKTNTRNLRKRKAYRLVYHFGFIFFLFGIFFLFCFIFLVTFFLLSTRCRRHLEFFCQCAFSSLKTKSFPAFRKRAVKDITARTRIYISVGKKLIRVSFFLYSVMNGRIIRYQKNIILTSFFYKKKIKTFTYD